MQNTKSIKATQIIEANNVRIIFSPLNEQIGCNQNNKKRSNKTDTSSLNQSKKKSTL